MAQPVEYLAAAPERTAVVEQGDSEDIGLVVVDEHPEALHLLQTDRRSRREPVPSRSEDLLDSTRVTPGERHHSRVHRLTSGIVRLVVVTLAPRYPLRLSAIPVETIDPHDSSTECARIIRSCSSPS